MVETVHIGQYWNSLIIISPHVASERYVSLDFIDPLRGNSRAGAELETDQRVKDNEKNTVVNVFTVIKLLAIRYSAWLYKYSTTQTHNLTTIFGNNQTLFL